MTVVDPWKRLAQLERKGASEAWERATLVTQLTDEGASTRDAEWLPSQDEEGHA